MAGKQHKFVYVSAGATAIVFIILGPMMLRGVWHQRQVDKVFERYSAALVHKDYTTAYSLCSGEFTSALSYEEFVNQQHLLSGKFGELKSIRLQNSTVEGSDNPIKWVATLRAEHQYANNTTYFVYVFHLIDDQWQLFGYKQF